MKRTGNHNYCNKLVFLLFLTLTCCASAASFVIDHKNLDITKIPPYWIEMFKKNQLLIQCVGQSHSFQYENGLLLLEQTNPFYAVQIIKNPVEIKTESCLYILRSQYEKVYKSWSPYDGDDKYYWSTNEGQQLVRDTVGNLIASQYNLSASLWCWCWDICQPSVFFSQSKEFTDEYLGLYLNVVNQFNNDLAMHPTKFIYHTSVSDCTISDGLWRVTYMNDLIRQAANDANGILIDQADIENWNIDNTAQYIRIDEQGRTVYPRNPDYEESKSPDTITGDHANDALCLRKAASLWHLAARLAGWNGCTAVLGDMNGDCQIDISDFVFFSNQWLARNIDPDWTPIADIAPDGGDSIVDIQDFTMLSQNWQYTQCGAYFASDFNHDCRVNMEDLGLLAIAWLSETGQPEWNSRCDIMPVSGDGKVDFLDFTELSMDWLKQ